MNKAKAGGNLFVIAAPSGAGKTSLVAALCKNNPDLVVSISHTTRPIRKGEVDGVDYNFVTKMEFKRLLTEDAFLEYAKVYDCYYGTTKEFVANQLQQGHDVILEIDWQGARQVRSQDPTAASIFILPPSYEVLQQRLKARGQDDEQVIARRMQLAKNEISHYDEFDYLVVNDDFDQALSDLQAIIRASHLSREHCHQQIKHIITNLLL